MVNYAIKTRPHTKFVTSKVRQHAYVNPVGCTLFFSLSWTIRALKKVSDVSCLSRVRRAPTSDEAPRAIARLAEHKQAPTTIQLSFTSAP